MAQFLAFQALNIDYKIGFTVSVWVGGILASIVFLVLLYYLLRLRTDSITITLLLLFLSSPIFIVIGTCGFLVTYVISNWLFQGFSIGFYTTEFSSGVLILRIISLLIGLRIILMFIGGENLKLGVFKPLLSLLITPTKLGYEQVDRLEPHSWDYEILIATLAQYGFYESVMVVLWCLQILSVEQSQKTFIESRLIMWLILFIVDDWVIISDYYRVLKGRFIPSHKLRFNASNIALYGLCSIAIWRHSSYWALLGFMVIGGIGVACVAFFFGQTEQRRIPRF